MRCNDIMQVITQPNYNDLIRGKLSSKNSLYLYLSRRVQIYAPIPYESVGISCGGDGQWDFPRVSEMDDQCSHKKLMKHIYAGAS